MKRVFSTKKRFTEFKVVLRKNVFKRKKRVVLALVSLILHNLTRLHVSQCFHCFKTGNLQKNAFLERNNAF